MALVLKATVLIALLQIQYIYVFKVLILKQISERHLHN